MAAEHFLQFIWKHRLLSGKPLRTTCGMDLEIINPGEANVHAGPDFFNARIRLDKIIWAGYVEIHRRSSDWYRHGHHLDSAYNNVILHVVGEYDTDITNSRGRRIQTLVADYHENLIKRYAVLKKSESWLPCSSYIGDFPPAMLKHWLGSLQKERVAQKWHRMEQILRNPLRNRDDTLYLALAMGYGLPLNTMPFELLARGVPYKALINYCDSLPDIEALLFGHSGLLFAAKERGPYPTMLWNRYLNLKKTLPEKPVPGHLWRFLRLRPASFPTLRIAQFASLIHYRVPLTDSLLDTVSLTEMEQTLRTGASEYWNTHYLFGKKSPPVPKFPGEQFVSKIMINVMVPFLYALQKNDISSRAGKLAGEILLQLKAESNQIIKNWATFGIQAGSALESQALLQLYNVYCKQKRCQDCKIGAVLIKAAIREKE